MSEMTAVIGISPGWSPPGLRAGLRQDKNPPHAFPAVLHVALLSGPPVWPLDLEQIHPLKMTCHLAQEKSPEMKWNIKQNSLNGHI